MGHASNEATRRRFLISGSTGLAAMLESVSPASAAEPTADEKANMKVVTDFCQAFSGHDLTQIMSFMADPCSYRVTEATEPVKGQAPVKERIGGFLQNVQRFEIHDTFARGPMVFNERTDYFSGGRLKSWHGVGVFFLKDGKIVEWQDFTISTERT